MMAKKVSDEDINRALEEIRFAGVELHEGLVCLNGPEGMDLDLQKELYEVALDELKRDGDLVNNVLEVSLATVETEIEIVRYPIPS